MKNIKIDTVIRTICLVLALVNQGLTMAGVSPLPIEDEQVTELVTLLCTVVAAVWAWWKNNSFTPAAIMADEVMHDIKAGVTIEFSDEEADG